MSDPGMDRHIAELRRVLAEAEREANEVRVTFPEGAKIVDRWVHNIRLTIAEYEGV